MNIRNHPAKYFVGISVIAYLVSFFIAYSIPPLISGYFKPSDLLILLRFGLTLQVAHIPLTIGFYFAFVQHGMGHSGKDKRRDYAVGGVFVAHALALALNTVFQSAEVFVTATAVILMISSVSLGAICLSVFIFTAAMRYTSGAEIWKVDTVSILCGSLFLLSVPPFMQEVLLRIGAM